MSMYELCVRMPHSNGEKKSHFQALADCSADSRRKAVEHFKRAFALFPSMQNHTYERRISLAGGTGSSPYDDNFPTARQTGTQHLIVNEVVNEIDNGLYGLWTVRKAA